MALYMHAYKQGGLGGLVLRLKADGHGAVKLVGPPGEVRPLWTGLTIAVAVCSNTHGQPSKAPSCCMCVCEPRTVPC